VGIYEPVHGSAPDIAGKGLANPLAAVLSVAMLLRHSFNLEREASTVEASVLRVLENGGRTRDLVRNGEPFLTTTEMGDAVRGTFCDVAQSFASRATR
jgi:3-isopropylmalate dehydrogenase